MGGKGAHLLAQGIQPEKLKVQMQQVFGLHMHIHHYTQGEKKLHKLGASAKKKKEKRRKQ